MQQQVQHSVQDVVLVDEEVAPHPNSAVSASSTPSLLGSSPPQQEPVLNSATRQLAFAEDLEDDDVQLIEEDDNRVFVD